MNSSIKLFSVCSTILFVIILYGCNNSSEPETLFESTERYSNNFDFSPSINQIAVTNPIGFIFLYGSTDTTKVRYVIDRTVKAKTKSLAEIELKKINLEHLISDDTLFCNIIYPSDLNNLYEGNLSLDVPYKKNIKIKNPNQGIYAAYLSANLEVETKNWKSTIEQHNGSLEVNSVGGNITATLDIQKDGFCKCYTDSGDIYIRIPANTSANVNIKTITGSITYTNLNLSIDTSSNQALKGVLGSGEGNIFLESKKGKIVLEGF